jgi:prolyl 4-hydroxylase
LAVAAASNNNQLLISTAALSPTLVPLTVQDRPMTAPVYNGVNPNYPGLKVLHNSPPVFCVENFLNPAECDFLVGAAHDAFGPAPVVGKGTGEISPSRTSSTCYLAREDLPDLLRKITLLTGKPVDHCELPQVGRYLPSQQYLQHYDAFDLTTEDGRRFASNGGQRTITVLIYLNDVHRGGATRFPAIDLDVQPVRGMALVFFPATIDGMLDQMALHAAMPAVDPKYVSQVWIRQGPYNGQPSKRLAMTLGVPFGQEHVVQARPPAPGALPLMPHNPAAVGVASVPYPL